jgi:hypothetical protein
MEEKLKVPADYSYPIVKIEGECIVLKNDWGAERKSPFFDSC